MVRFFFTLSAIFLTLQPLSSSSQEWSRFRGENGSGIGRMTQLPAEFTKAAYDWAIKLEGVGHSSPVLWGEQLFLTINSDDGKDRRIESYDARTGKRLWKWSAPLEEHNLHKHNNFASSTPVATANAVFAVWGSGEKTEAVALTHDGELIWKREWPSFSSDHGFGASPIASNGALVLHTDSVQARVSQVIGLDLKTGETIWEVERKTTGEDEKHLTAYNTPTTVKINGQEMVIVLQTNDGWKGLDPATGELIWSHPGAYTMRSVGSIASEDGLLFATFGSGGNGKQGTALRPGTEGPPELLYELGIKDGLGYVPTPLIHNGLLYLWGDGGVLTCRDAETGAEIYRERVGGNFFSSPVITDGKILCGSRDGELIAVRLGPKFEILGRSRLVSGMNATPAIANNRLYLRTDTHLISIKGK
ncbi:MAG: PQQ-binding-like beta-propeller repeat protein [Verrucomicrobiales bacterium]|nr:PQQ-binding-like beta-propeller repeat protein [Verrucomicrobiales bacterium]